MNEMSAATTLLCWKCGAALTDLPLPLTRLAACPVCRVELHVCRACVFFAREVANQCREPVAEPVSDKTRSNFCGYFQLRADAYRAAAPVPASRAQLDALFGSRADASAGEGGASSPSALDELFGGKPDTQ